MTGVQILDASLLGLLGLLIGSFLNVVIYRLPVMLEAQWQAECADMQGQTPPEKAPFSLLVPRSRCQSCGHQLAWFENIPVVSYLMLRGRCRHCQAGISLRYPLVELTTGLLFLWCGWQWGATATGLAWCGFCAALVTLGMIDWDTTLLPDDLTLPLLWLVYWGFKLVTGKEGMGYGDFKLFAALGAWFGWQALIPIILMASVIGAIVGIGLKFSKNLREGGYVPFGPFLAGAGLTALLAGPNAMLKAVGL